MSSHNCWIHDELWRTDSDYRCQKWETLHNMLCVFKSIKRFDKEITEAHTSKNSETAEETTIRMNKSNK